MHHSLVSYIYTVRFSTEGDGFSGQIFRIFEIKFFCFVVAICDLVHGVETIFHSP